MHLSFQALVLAALSLEGALAQPAHRHQHKHRRDLADVLGDNADLVKRVDFNNKDLYKDVQWDQVCANGGCSGGQPGAAPKNLAVNPVNAGSPAPQQGSTKSDPNAQSSPASSSPASAPSSTSSAAPSGSSGPSSGGSTGSCSDLKSVWTSGDTSSKAQPDKGKTSSGQTPWYTLGEKTSPQNIGATDSYIGNVGMPYGSNMLPLPNCDVSSQKFSITFTNADSKQIQVALWNKAGSDGKPLSGASLNAFWKFPLEAGQSAAFAIAENSQLGFSQACDRNTYPGSYDCTWGEADFGDLNTPNNGGSGYDRSSIQNSKGNTGLLDVCVDGHDCSTGAANSFVSDQQTHATGDLYIPPGQPMHLKVKMG